MRSLGERLHLLRKRLINLRCGPGAAILPPEVTRIHMDFATSMSNGHMGARKFWRQYLPRLKYHNPAVPMILNRHDDNAAPPVMTIYMRASAGSSSSAAPAAETSQPASSRTGLSKAQPPGADEKVVTIDMRNRHSSDILEFFLAETRARALQPTSAEIAEIQSLEAIKTQGGVDRERVRALRAEKKKEEDMLKRARAAGGMAEQEEA
ncbi:mitochondrial ribosomal protein L51 / S25 / CI-B8 domain protein [Metarhizium robertsii]|uniref:Mitochondrial ribosomal protein L51 / S25 / CI-B8 domain protein n=1 Tax=Metarhizium robertsii TaxID=568076 RepID=A0A014PQB2_9HYPO|nr:mitochondrial ribosomal protein L51 / S25 / CI-B8 domain protein [Metarhizium robertsii]